MKNYLLSFTLFLVFLSSVWSQSEVIIQKRIFKSDPQTAFVVSVEREGVKDKDIDKMWKSYLKNFDTKPDFDKESELSVAEEAMVSKISNGPLKIFMRKNNVSKVQTEFTIWIKDSNNQFVGSAASDANTDITSQWVLDYAICIKRHQKEEILEELEDDLKSLEKEKKKLDKEVKSAQKAIEKMRDKIEDEEKDIREAKEELPEVSRELSSKKMEVDLIRKELEQLRKRKGGE